MGKDRNLLLDAKEGGADVSSSVLPTVEEPNPVHDARIKTEPVIVKLEPGSVKLEPALSPLPSPELWCAK
jgi:hypothetical protein